MARTAAVVVIANAIRNAVNRRQANKNAAAYSQAMNQAAPQASPPQEQAYYAPPVEQNDVIAQLDRLGALKAQGLLTEDEFAAAKQQLLAG